MLVASIFLYFTVNKFLLYLYLLGMWQSSIINARFNCKLFHPVCCCIYRHS